MKITIYNIQQDATINCYTSEGNVAQKYAHFSEKARLLCWDIFMAAPCRQACNNWSKHQFMHKTNRNITYINVIYTVDICQMSRTHESLNKVSTKSIDRISLSPPASIGLNE